MEENIVIEEKKKTNVIIKFFAFIIMLILIVFSYMYFVETKLLVTHEYAIINSSIPNSFNGFKIVQFSDIHFGRTTNEKEVSKLVETINLNKPDILVFTGDLFDSYINLSEENINFLKTELGKTTAILGKYAIKGDSDYLNNGKYEEIMEAAGFKILTNENIPIYYQENVPIFLSGMPSASHQEQDVTKAFSKDIEGNYYQIILIHEPLLFHDVKGQANLVLAGHTLGGLINIPFVGGIIKKENTSNYTFGKYTSNSSTLFVSNGIGTENISLRFNNIPSINLYRLYNY